MYRWLFTSVQKLYYTRTGNQTRKPWCRKLWSESVSYKYIPNARQHRILTCLHSSVHALIPLKRSFPNYFVKCSISDKYYSAPPPRKYIFFWKGNKLKYVVNLFYTYTFLLTSTVRDVANIAPFIAHIFIQRPQLYLKLLLIPPPNTNIQYKCLFHWICSIDL